MLSRLKAMFRKPPPGLPAQLLLYSTPSISDAVGAVTRDTASGAERLLIEPDDWRHTELVHADFSAAVGAELDDILAIHRQYRQPAGWSRVHIRKRIPEPLADVPILVPELLKTLPERSFFSSVGYRGTAGVVEDGYAFRTAGGLTLYGQTHAGGEGRLRSICFEPCKPGEPQKLAQEIAALVDLARTQGLELICWNKVCRLAPDPAEWQRFFTSIYQF